MWEGFGIATAGALIGFLLRICWERYQAAVTARTADERFLRSLEYILGSYRDALESNQMWLTADNRAIDGGRTLVMPPDQLDEGIPIMLQMHLPAALRARADLLELCWSLAVDARKYNNGLEHRVALQGQRPQVETLKGVNDQLIANGALMLTKARALVEALPSLVPIGFSRRLPSRRARVRA